MSARRLWRSPVADYLVSEVLSQLPGDVRAFLLVTAVPEKLTVELAGELTGRVDAGAVLEPLARDNALAYRQDSSPRLYHYHSLLRGYLLAELNRQDAAAARRLHIRAADWFAGYDAPSLALAHAVAANDWSRGWASASPMVRCYLIAAWGSCK